MKRFLSLLLVYLPTAFVLWSLLQVLTFPLLPVSSTPMALRRHLQHEDGGTSVDWTPLECISPAMTAAVVAGEDCSFYSHHGFDFAELGLMLVRHRDEGARLRGCSTLSQQTAKNCFTWGTRTYFRKVVEAYYTVLIEVLWGKERILETYLNVAEFGPGIYGIAAASRHYYGVDPSRLTLADASSLVCCLPSPRTRTPDYVNTHLAHLRHQTALRSQSMMEESK